MGKMADVLFICWLIHLSKKKRNESKQVSRLFTESILRKATARDMSTVVVQRGAEKRNRVISICVVNASLAWIPWQWIGHCRQPAQLFLIRVREFGYKSPMMYNRRMGENECRSSHFLVEKSKCRAVKHRNLPPISPTIFPLVYTAAIKDSWWQFYRILLAKRSLSYANRVLHAPMKSQGNQNWRRLLAERSKCFENEPFRPIWPMNFNRTNLELWIDDFQTALD